MQTDSQFHYFTSGHPSKSGGGPRTSTQPKPVSGPKKPEDRGKVRVHAGAGDKCVPPAKSRPKKRKAVRDGEDGPGIGMECVEWSDDHYHAAQLVAAFGHQLPVIARVMSGCQSHGGYELTTGQVIQVHSYGRQKRIVAGYSKGGQLSIPQDYPMEIYTKEGQTGERWKLQQAVEVKKLPLKAQVLSLYDQVDNQPPVPLIGEELIIKKVEEDIFLRANPITDGWIDQNELVIIPGCSKAKFSIAVGMRGASHSEWEDYFGMFARSVRHLNLVFITGYQGVLLQDVPSSARTSVATTSDLHSPAPSSAVYENITRVKAMLESSQDSPITSSQYANIPGQSKPRDTPEKQDSIKRAVLRTNGDHEADPRHSTAVTSNSIRRKTVENSDAVYAEIDKELKRKTVEEAGKFTPPVLSPVPPAVPKKQISIDDDLQGSPALRKPLKPSAFKVAQSSPRLSTGRPSTPFSEADEEDLQDMFASVITLAEEQDRLESERQASLRRGEGTEMTVVVETYSAPPVPNDATQSYENPAFTNDEHRLSGKILNNNNTTIDKPKKKTPTVASKPRQIINDENKPSSPSTGSSTEDPTGKQRITVGRVSSRRKDNSQYTPKAVVQPNMHIRDSQRGLTSDETPAKSQPTQSNSNSASPGSNLPQQKSVIETMEDVPDELSGMTVEDVCRCLILMNMESHVAHFRRQKVEGQLLSNMKESVLQQEFHFNPFNSSKLMRFVRGWRPKLT